MTSYRRGDIALVRFVFADETGAKLRPVLVVSSGPYQRSRREAIVAAITSNVSRPRFGDHSIQDWGPAGLLFPSVATAILRTVKLSMIERRLGRLGAGDLAAVERALRACLALSPP